MREKVLRDKNNQPTNIFKKNYDTLILRKMRRYVGTKL